MPQHHTDLPSLQAYLVGLVERARAVDVASYEQADSTRIRRELVPQTTVLVKEAINFLECLFDRYDPDQGEGAGASAQAAERIADLSFMARSELRRKLEFLAGLRTGVDTWQVIAVCGRCLGKLARAMTAVEAALCAHESCEAVLVYDSELAHSLKVRRAYGQLCHDLRNGKKSSIAESLQSAANSIASLMGHEIYAALRIGDRVQLSGLREHIFAWQRAPERDLRTGLRLWQDVWGVAHLFLDVNKRQELVEHDRQALAELRRRLDGGGEVTPEVRCLLEALLGRDEELDILLLGGKPLEARSLESPLRRLCGRHDLPLLAAPSTQGLEAPAPRPLSPPVTGIHRRAPSHAASQAGSLHIG